MDYVGKLVAPHPHVIASVNNWLASYGIENRRLFAHKDFIAVETTVAVARELLAAEFYTFLHKASGLTLVKSLGPYTVPRSIAKNLDFVVGHLGFPAPKKVQQPVGSSIPVNPVDLRQRYNVSSSTAGTNPNNRMAVAEFQAQYYAPTDLDTFFSRYMPGYNSKVAKVVGSNNAAHPGVEASLDIEYLMGVAPNVPTWFWSNPSFDFYTDLTDWVDQIESTNNGPWVHSVSYGDQSEGPSSDYQNRLDGEFQKISATGVSILFSSGDSGTGCASCAKFYPAYPSTSIYVTAVGATEFIGNSIGPEQATTSFGSGGGFSWNFPRPSYQNAAVNGYLSSQGSHLPPAHFYNSPGRATPDVSALGIGYQVIVNGRTESVGGTSASAPTFAALISLLNDRRLNQGKPTLGFLNNWIYQTAAAHKDAFFDVVVGNNHNGCCGDGFQCAVGWDPVTGVGTPNYAALVNYLP